MQSQAIVVQVDEIFHGVVA